MNNTYYLELRQHFCEIVRIKRRDTWQEHFWIFVTIMPTHASLSIREFLATVVSDPSYSPDFAHTPANFFVSKTQVNVKKPTFRINYMQLKKIRWRNCAVFLNKRPRNVSKHRKGTFAEGIE